MSSAADDVREPAADRSAEAAAHLQRATLEFIAAARTLLDVAEEAVREPAGLMDTVGATIGALVGALGSMNAPPRASHGPSGGADGPGAPDAPAATRSRRGVEHIRIS